MTIDRIKLCALAAALATAVTGEPYAQSPGSTAAATAPGATPALSAPAGTQQGTPQSISPAQTRTPALGAPAASQQNTPQSTSPAPSRKRNDPTTVQGTSPAATQPSASRGLSAGANSAAEATTNGSAITGGVPAIGGVTPNRAELASSAFTKLDAASRGYLTVEDVRQLNGFESAFRQADQNGDGRLNQSEFNSAWSAFTGNAR